jgi:hypothetical protein
MSRALVSGFVKALWMTEARDLLKVGAGAGTAEVDAATAFPCPWPVQPATSPRSTSATAVRGVLFIQLSSRDAQLHGLFFRPHASETRAGMAALRLVSVVTLNIRCPVLVKMFGASKSWVTGWTGSGGLISVESGR